jgi:mevalonate kinase
MSVPAVSDVNGKPALRRKQSTPMMPPFMVSAPGKVIVYGEHAVVHGKVHDKFHLAWSAP